MSRAGIVGRYRPGVHASPLCQRECFETGDNGVDVGGPVPYEIPSTDQCDTCHGGRQDKTLGFDAVALGLAGATGVTLANLVADNRLTNNPRSRRSRF